MLLPLKNIAGEQVGEVQVSDSIFAAPISKPLMHQVLLRQLSNARLGTHKTKTRGEVAGGGRKPFRQKGTGRARQGSIRASQWVGGGTVFGPRPRKYIKQLPKKMNAAALRCALSIKAAADQIVVVDTLPFETPKTKVMVQALSALGIHQDTVLLVVAEKSTGVMRSASNLPNVKALLSGYLNIRDLLGYEKMLISKDALEHVELWLMPANGATEEVEVEEADMETAEVEAGDANDAPEKTEG